MTMTQEELAEHRRNNGTEMFRPNLPWPVVRFEEQHRTYRKQNGEMISTEDKRVYRFFSGIQAVRHTNDRTGYSWSDVQYESPYWSSLMVLGLYSGLAPLTIRMPRDLYMIPVFDSVGESADPLAWAINPPSTPMQRRAARMDAKKGMHPQLMFWASALVEEPLDDKGGANTYVAVVQMRKNQATKLADKWESYVRMARVKGKEADMSGIPVNVWENKAAGAREHELDLFRADGDRIDLIKEYEAPDHELLASALRSELDRFLTESGAAIAGFPEPESHQDDGWRTDSPACLQQQAPRTNGRKSPGGLDEFAGEEDFTKLSNRDLKELLQSKGAEIPANASRERMIAMLEDHEYETAE